MSDTPRARSLILDRIRRAGGPSRPANGSGIPRDYDHCGNLPPARRVELFAERLREYDAEVILCARDRLVPSIAATLGQSGRQRFVAPPGIPAEWMVPGFEWSVDHGLSPEQIELSEGVLTAASAGVADSGTIVLHHTPGEGRRILSLLPDWHLSILAAGQIMETLPEYFSRAEPPPGLVTWISGPSATADIEMTRIKGVHGPRFLNVIIVQDA